MPISGWLESPKFKIVASCSISPKRTLAMHEVTDLTVPSANETDLVPVDEVSNVWKSELGKAISPSKPVSSLA